MSKELEPKLYNEYQRMRANNLDLFSFDSLYKSKKESKGKKIPIPFAISNLNLKSLVFILLILCLDFFLYIDL